MVWDKSNLSAPHTTREIAQIPQGGAATGAQGAVAAPDSGGGQRARYAALRDAAAIARKVAEEWVFRGAMADGARNAAAEIERRIMEEANR